MIQKLSQNELTQIVSESVNKILKEWTNGDMPGLSKNPKVRDAQNHAKTKVVGVPGKNDNSWNHQKQSEGGEDKVGKPDLNWLIQTMRFSKDEEDVRKAGEKFATIMNKNKEVGNIVFHALADISLKHYNDFYQWNRKNIAEGIEDSVLPEEKEFFDIVSREFQPSSPSVSSIKFALKAYQAGDFKKVKDLIVPVMRKCSGPMYLMLEVVARSNTPYQKMLQSAIQSYHSETAIQQSRKNRNSLN